MSPKVFVSHSAREPAEIELLAQLRTALTAQGMDYFIAEHDIVVTEEWKQRLNDELRECDAGLLLLTPSALVSDWVDSEAAVLMYRRSGDDEFPVIVGLTAGVDRVALKASRLDRYGLSDLHLMRFPAGTAGVDKLIADETVRRVPAHGPLRPLEDLMMGLMADIDRSLLDLAGGRLEISLRGMTVREKRRAVARALLASDPETFVHALEVFCAGHRGHAAKILDLSFPFTWIDEITVRPLGAPATEALPPFTFGLNSGEVVTARMYVRRSSVQPAVRWAETIESSEWNSATAQLNEVRAALRPLLGVRPFETVPDDRLRSLLAKLERRSGPIVMLLPGGLDEDGLTAIEQAFPSLVYLVLTGSTPAPMLPASIRFLHPALDPDAELDTLRSYWAFEPMVRSR